MDVFRPHLRAALDGWVLFVRLGASATLTVAYIVPVLRLMPFVSAEDALEPGPVAPRCEKPWGVNGRLVDDGIDVTISRGDPPKAATP